MVQTISKALPAPIKKPWKLCHFEPFWRDHRSDSRRRRWEIYE